MAICRLLHESAQPALFSGPTPSFPSLESEAGTSRWGDILSWQGTFGPRTTSPGGQLVLGPHVRGDSWSGGTRGPPTPAVCSSRCSEIASKATFGPKRHHSHASLLSVRLCMYDCYAVAVAEESKLLSF